MPWKFIQNNPATMAINNLFNMLDLDRDALPECPQIRKLKNRIPS